MAKRTDLEFAVRWYPFQLNAQAPKESNKCEMYMGKFNMSKADAMAKGEWMKGKFAEVGLPFRFTDTDLTGNSFEAHRVMTAAFEHGGTAAQDKAAEILFHNYFAEGKAPSDPSALLAAATAAGCPDAATDSSIASAQTKEEFAVGQRMGVRGVPHFAIYTEGSKKQELSGAQPPTEFVAAFDQITQ